MTIQDLIDTLNFMLGDKEINLNTVIMNDDAEELAALSVSEDDHEVGLNRLYMTFEEGNSHD